MADSALLVLLLWNSNAVVCFAASVLRFGNFGCCHAELCFVPGELVPVMLSNWSLSFGNIHVHWW